jgi:hypothetical protein
MRAIQCRALEATFLARGCLARLQYVDLFSGRGGRKGIDARGWDGRDWCRWREGRSTGNVAVLVHILEAIENDIQRFWSCKVRQLAEVEVDRSDCAIRRAAIE